ncbi:MAG: hypothetical protein PVJ63_06655 [Thioalkalispiraceae bacterium]|jgi:hypothetical protein
MHTIQIHVEETLTSEQLQALKNSLLSIPHIQDVSMSPRDPHDFLVDFEEAHNTPIAVMHELHQQGLHPDITSC